MHSGQSQGELTSVLLLRLHNVSPVDQWPADLS